MTTQKIAVNPARTVNADRPVFIGSQRDNMGERIVFTGLPELKSGQSVAVRWVLNDGSAGDIVTLAKTEDGYAWDVESSITQYAGHGLNLSGADAVQSAARWPVAAGYVQITGSGGVVWSTKPFAILIAPLPADGGQLTPPELSAIQQMLEAIASHNTEMADALKAAKVVNTSVSTLAPGSAATLSRTESANGVTLDFGIPRGDTGAAGPNMVGATTDSNIAGILKGSGGKVAQAVPGTDYATPAQVDAVTSQLADIMSDVQRIDDALAPLSLNIDSWKSVQQVVQAGLAPKVFPIGTQLLVSHSVYGDRLYDVVAHDYLMSVHDQNAHTMTILQHDLLPALQFDAPEAFYYAETELPAGTYNFTLAATYSSWLAGTYEFTLTQAVPTGGQLTISGYADADMTARQVRSFASRTTTAVTESVAIISSNGGTNLGTFGEQLNHSHRVSYGSNNYKESAMRQFLNSGAAAGSVWTPQSKFDRPPSWLTTTAGFVGGLDQDFLAVVGDVVLPCSANNTYEYPDSTVVKNIKYTLNEKFYLPSQREVFGVNTDIVADDSVLLPFYDGATAADRIKYWDGSAVRWWLRTPGSWTASYVRLVGSGGAVYNYVAGDSYALAPACTIV